MGRKTKVYCPVYSTVSNNSITEISFVQNPKSFEHTTTINAVTYMNHIFERLNAVQDTKNYKLAIKLFTIANHIMNTKQQEAQLLQRNRTTHYVS